MDTNNTVRWEIKLLDNLCRSQIKICWSICALKRTEIHTSTTKINSNIFITFFLLVLIIINVSHALTLTCLISQQFPERLLLHILYKGKQRHRAVMLLDPSHTPGVWQIQDSNHESNSGGCSLKPMVNCCPLSQYFPLSGGIMSGVYFSSYNSYTFPPNFLYSFYNFKRSK